MMTPAQFDTYIATLEQRAGAAEQHADTVAASTAMTVTEKANARTAAVNARNAVSFARQAYGAEVAAAAHGKLSTTFTGAQTALERRQEYAGYVRSILDGRYRDQASEMATLADQLIAAVDKKFPTTVAPPPAPAA